MSGATGHHTRRINREVLCPTSGVDDRCRIWICDRPRNSDAAFEPTVSSACPGHCFGEDWRSAVGGDSGVGQARVLGGVVTYQANGVRRTWIAGRKAAIAPVREIEARYACRSQPQRLGTACTARNCNAVAPACCSDGSRTHPAALTRQVVEQPPVNRRRRDIDGSDVDVSVGECSRRKISRGASRLNRVGRSERGRELELATEFA